MALLRAFSGEDHYLLFVKQIPFMKLIRPLFFCCCLLLAGHLSSQDLHWTLYNFSPLTLNPGFTGAYEGSFRVGGIFRDQAPNVTSARGLDDLDERSNLRSLSNVYFPSYNFYIDAPLIRGFRKQDWVGVGGTFYSDQAGDVALGLTYVYGSVAYHLALDKKAKTVLTLGVQGGTGSRGVNEAGKALLESDIRMNFQSPTSSFNAGSSTFFDLNTGLLLRSKVNKKTDLNVGMNFRHLVTTNYALQGDLRLPLTFVIHSQLDTELNDKWSLAPTVMLLNAGNATETQLQGMLGYLFNEEKAVTLNFGLGYRVGDAGQFLLGMEYGAFRAAASFDLTLSGLNQINNSVGGFELGVSYIGRIYKDPPIKPVLFCPRF